MENLELQEDLESQEEKELHPEKMTDPQQILAYMFAGDATLTFKSIKSQNRYTFRIKKGDEDKDRGRKAPFFVKLLIGCNNENENDYAYMGMITLWNGKPSFRLTSASIKAHLTEDDKRIKAFRWTFDPLTKGEMPRGVEIWHEGRCSRCHRMLTDDESIKRGFGPICYKLMGGGLGVAAFASTFISASSNPTASTDNHRHFEPKPYPKTPKIILETNEDPDIVQVSTEMGAKNPADFIGDTPVCTYQDNAIIAMVNDLRNTDFEKFTMDGIMNEKEAVNFWYHRFSNTTQPLEG